MSPAGPERLELVVLGDPAEPVALPASGMLVVGASAERAGVVVSGQGVDDAHCAIGPVKGGGWAVKDLGSRYGTIVNGKRTQAARLAAGDVILIGSRRLRIVDPAAPEPGAEPEPPRAATPPADAAPAASAPSPSSAGTAGPAGAVDAATRVVPKRIGGYRVERVLGRGGMGTVLLAVQESLNRPVALKLLPPRLAADREFVRRFQSEARAAAALSHPNVVVVHDVGEAEGFHFLSMEYMERGSLEDRLQKEGRLPWREVLDVLHDAARGLVFAEERGIVHRDVKPANLMQTAAGATKIADLGLATSVEAEASESDGRRILGTPHFISPEQARGEPVDARSDLYSLGATAYRLLTGRTPFRGDTTRDILRGHFTETPEPLSTAVPDVPPGLEALVLRLLEKEPSARPRSAADVLTEVDRLRLEADHGVPAEAAAGRRLPLALGAAALLLLAAAGAWLLLRPGGRGAQDDRLAGGATSTDPQPRAPDESELFERSAEEEADAAAALEQRLRERNLLAENAYLRLDPYLTRDARIGELERLAEEFAGTDAAARMRKEIADLEAEGARLAAEAAAASSALAAAEQTLRAAVGLDGSSGAPPAPGEALRAVQAFAPPAEVAPEAAEELKRRVGEEVVARASEHVARELERAGALAAEGRFDEVEALLLDLEARLDLPDYGAAQRPAGFDELALHGSAVRGRLKRLPSERRAWAETRAAADRVLLSDALRGGALGEALSALDLEGAAAALDALLPRLGSDPATSFAQGLRADVGAARAMLDGLRAAFQADLWRRRTVLDPRGGRGTTREAVAIDAEGLSVDVGGAAERVPWSAFAASPDAWAQLFKERLSREYTPEERSGGAALLRIAAAQRAAALAAQKLDPESKARFSAAEAAALVAPYEAAEPWARAEPRFAREGEAAARLARALSDLEEGLWSAAEADLVALLADYDDTLLVRLCSDGSRWAAAEAAAPAEARGTDAKSDGEPAPPGGGDDAGGGDRNDAQTDGGGGGGGVDGGSGPAEDGAEGAGRSALVPRRP